MECTNFCSSFRVRWNLVRPGTRTDEIDKAVHQMINDHGAYPSPLGYGGFPKSVYTSVNECICHEILDSCELEDGDIINVDVTVYLNGCHGDTSATFLCGDVDEEATTLVQLSACLTNALNATKADVEEGIVVGGGCALLRLASKIDVIKETLDDAEQKVGADIVKRALGYPFKLIAKNVGVNGSVVAETVLSNDNTKYGYKRSNW